MADLSSVKIVQVTNICPSVTTDQIRTLFAYLGKISELKLFPLGITPPTGSKVCYMRYEKSDSVVTALHLTNTVFIDRALIVVPFVEDTIPDEAKAMQMAAPGNALAGNLSTKSLFPSNLPIGSISEDTANGMDGMIHTADPRLEQMGLPPYPPLPGSTDPIKVEEIRRTVFVGNLGRTITANQLLEFCQTIGEVKYVRMAGDEEGPTKFAYIEFSDQASISKALQFDSVIFQDRPIKMQHSTVAIQKPREVKSNKAAALEVEEAIKKANEAQSLISAAAIESGKANSK